MFSEAERETVATYLQLQRSLVQETKERLVSIELQQRTKRLLDEEVPNKRRRLVSPSDSEISCTRCPLFYMSASELLSLCENGEFGNCSAVCRSMARARYDVSAWGDACRSLSPASLPSIASQVLVSLMTKRTAS